MLETVNLTYVFPVLLTPMGQISELLSVGPVKDLLFLISVRQHADVLDSTEDILLS